MSYESNQQQVGYVAVGTAGYPPQQGGYPPQQGGYPPQQGGYPPQQGGYPPQWGGYPIMQPISPAPYQTNLCDFFMDGSSCLDAWFCHWCQLGNQYEKMTTGRSEMNVGMCCGLFCVDQFTWGIGTVFASWYIRNKAKVRYNIISDDFTEIASAVCCVPCSISQVYREMSLRQEWPGGICVNGPFVQVPGGPVPPQQQTMVNNAAPQGYAQPGAPPQKTVDAQPY